MMRKSIMLGMLMAFFLVAPLAFADEVLITPNGAKYHKEDCRLIKNKSRLTKMDKEEAVKKGYGPCRRCFAAEAMDPITSPSLIGIEKFNNP